jgi:hypothetical protein
MLPLVSLLLCAAATALWARASRHQDAVFFHTRDSTNALFSGQGRIVFNRTHRPGSNPPDVPVFAYQHMRMEPRRWFLPAALGFGFAIGRTIQVPTTTTYTGFAIPYWFIILALLIAPITSLRRRLRLRRRQRQGLCLRCGYDLRATAHRCPECGSRKDAPPPSAELIPTMDA